MPAWTVEAPRHLQAGRERGNITESWIEKKRAEALERRGELKSWRQRERWRERDNGDLKREEERGESEKGTKGSY